MWDHFVKKIIVEILYLLQPVNKTCGFFSPISHQFSNSCKVLVVRSLLKVSTAGENCTKPALMFKVLKNIPGQAMTKMQDEIRRR